jgi:hypothetical protein
MEKLIIGQNNETFSNPINNLGINQIKGQLDIDDNPQDTKPIQRPNVNYYEDETNQNQAASN